ncbi:hypothetical protein DFJ74DRAFT_713412 [Hyaloraphidium curvatum]|nr:hypothetical protein DFJ74DRAFT_713412 [Hyaloraphidium curvatum]
MDLAQTRVDLPSVRDLWAARRLRSTWHESSSSVQRRRSSDPKPASWKPPPRRESAFEYLDRYPSYLIWGIIAISGAVFLAWQYAIQSAQRFGDWKALRFMRMNFLCDWNGVVGAKRVWTLLTSTFSHNEMWHFGINMFVLHSFGSTVIQTIGSRLFLQLYLLSGVASSCAGLVYYRLFDRRSNAPSHGASGSITAITAVFASIYPTATIFVWFIPMPAWAAVAGLVGMDVYRAASGTSGRTNTAAHIGGALTGLAYFFIRIKPYLRPL